MEAAPNTSENVPISNTPLGTQHFRPTSSGSSDEMWAEGFSLYDLENILNNLPNEVEYTGLHINSHEQCTHTLRSWSEPPSPGHSPTLDDKPKTPQLSSLNTYSMVMPCNVSSGMSEWLSTVSNTHLSDSDIEAITELCCSGQGISENTLHHTLEFGYNLSLPVAEFLVCLSRDLV